MTKVGINPRTEWLIPAIAIAAFLFLAAYRLDAPGLYADEVLFGSASLHALGHCGVESAVARHVGHCFPVVIEPPYLGALKAWVYTPLLAMGSVDGPVLRWPMLLVTALALLVLWGALRRQVDPMFAAISVFVFALDPTLAFHSRFDWGPFAISNLCKIAMLAALWRWLGIGGARWLALALLAASIGVFDKINFLWLIAGAGTACLVAYGSTVWSRLREQPIRHAIVVLAFAVVALVMWGVYVGPALLQSAALPVPQPSDFDSRLARFEIYYDEAFGASNARNWIAAAYKGVPRWPWYLLLAQLTAGVLLLATRPWSVPSLRLRWRLHAFVSVMLLTTLAAILATRQVGGAHHAVVLWPLPSLHLLMTVDLVFRRFAADRAAAMAVVIAACAMVAVAVPPHLEMRAVWRGEFGFQSQFDPAIAQLASATESAAADSVVTLDWGLFEPMLMLAPSRRERTHAWWPWFNEVPNDDAAHDAWLKAKFRAEGESLWIGYVPKLEAIAGVRRNMPEYLRRIGGCLTLERVIDSAAGAPLYQIWRYRPDAVCPVPDLNALMPTPIVSPPGATTAR